MLMAFGGAAASRTIAFRNDRLRKNDFWKRRGGEGFGEGHDFSRAAEPAQTLGFSP